MRIPRTYREFVYYRERPESSYVNFSSERTEFTPTRILFDKLKELYPFIVCGRAYKSKEHFLKYRKG